MDIPRRSFVLGTASTGLSLLGNPIDTRSADGARHLAKRLRALSRDPVSARFVGEAYAALFPQEMGAGLPELILSSLPPERRTAAVADDRALAAGLAARVRDDFAQGHTVTIDGWLLSRTEARLCALWRWVTLDC